MMGSKLPRSMITCRKATFADDIQLGGGFKDFLF